MILRKKKPSAPNRTHLNEGVWGTYRQWLKQLNVKVSLLCVSPVLLLAPFLPLSLKLHSSLFTLYISSASPLVLLVFWIHFTVVLYSGNVEACWHFLGSVYVTFVEAGVFSNEKSPNHGFTLILPIHSGQPNVFLKWPVWGCCLYFASLNLWHETSHTSFVLQAEKKKGFFYLGYMLLFIMT